MADRIARDNLHIRKSFTFRC